MEQKMTTIPFDLELAKKIQTGEYFGKITTKDNKDARIVCWDAFNACPLVVLINGKIEEYSAMYNELGQMSWSDGNEQKDDLVLQVPEWTQFKDGDIIYCDTTDGCGDKCIWLEVMKELRGQVLDSVSISFYFAVVIKGNCKGETEFDGIGYYADNVRLANEEEKQQLIDALKQSTDPRAKEYLKRFFGIEEKKEYKFEPFQKVLVRFEDESPWEASLFSHIGDKEDEPFNTVGGINYAQCIPYNDQTKHLLGTTDNWEE